jgi:hypothetical protein
MVDLDIDEETKLKWSSDIKYVAVYWECNKLDNCEEDSDSLRVPYNTRNLLTS